MKSPPRPSLLSLALVIAVLVLWHQSSVAAGTYQQQITRLRTTRLRELSAARQSWLPISSATSANATNSSRPENNPELLRWEQRWQKMMNSSLLSCYWTVGDAPPPDRVNLTLCTHLILIGGVSITGAGQLDVAPATRHATRVLRSRIQALPSPPHRKPKLMLSITSPAISFSNVSSTEEKRKSFSTHAVTLLTSLKVDGIDFDWEFPVFSTKVAADKSNFPLLLREMRLSMLMSSAGGSGPNLLSAAVAAPKAIIDVAYDIPALARYVDFINLMAYDYHFYQRSNPIFWFTGYNSPLYPNKLDVFYLDTENTAWSSKAWVSGGLPASKLLVGIPTYGHTYRLAVDWWHTRWALATAPGNGSGWCNYQQVCAALRSRAMCRVFDPEARVPYAYSCGESSAERQWWSYEDSTSVKEKCAMIRSGGYAGAMVFDVNADDWDGSACGTGTYPLLNAVRVGLGTGGR